MAEAGNDLSRVEPLTATAASLKEFWDVLVPEGLVDGKGILGDKEMKQWSERLATGMAALAQMKRAFLAHQRVIGGLL